MSKGTMSAEDWAAKADNEGLEYALTTYGLSHKDLADDVDPEFRAAVKAAYKAMKKAQPAIDHLESLMDEYSN